MQEKQDPPRPQTEGREEPECLRRHVFSKGKKYNEGIDRWCRLRALASESGSWVHVDHRWNRGLSA